VVDHDGTTGDGHSLHIDQRKFELLLETIITARGLASSARRRIGVIEFSEANFTLRLRWLGRFFAKAFARTLSLRPRGHRIRLLSCAICPGIVHIIWAGCVDRVSMSSNGKHRVKSNCTGGLGVGMEGDDALADTSFSVNDVHNVVHNGPGFHVSLQLLEGIKDRVECQVGEEIGIVYEQ